MLLKARDNQKIFLKILTSSTLEENTAHWVSKCKNEMWKMQYDYRRKIVYIWKPKNKIHKK